MTEREELERRDKWEALGIRTDIPHPARVYDTAEYAARETTFVGRTKDEIGRMFNGRELVDPGVVLSYWRPDGGKPEHNADRVWGYCGVAKT